MILVYVEHNEEKLTKASKVTLAAALAAKDAHGYDSVTAVLLGSSGVEAAAQDAAGYGVDEVVYLEDDLLENYLGVEYGEALKLVVDELEPEMFMVAANSAGKDLAPRIAQHLEAGQASDIVSFEDDHGFKRPMYAGNVMAVVQITTEKKVVTVRGTAFDPAEQSGAQAGVRDLGLSLDGTKGTEFVSFDATQSERPELTEADVVISGGRALKSAENFEEFIYPLADLLNAAIGASRAAVDSGYAPNDWQVGQTGKVVAPNLYFAVGISGAIQHLAGMKDSKVIVGINKDPEAPIFEVADYGLVGDLYQVMPELTEAIRKAKGA